MKFSTTLLTSAAMAVVSAENWSTYPSVPKTASINGFADPIYAKLPQCAQECVKAPTDNTPCPYWDPGCLCYMPQWGSGVAECFVKNCKGADVQKASSLANGVCTSAGATGWMIPASLATEMGKATEAAATSSPAVTSAAASATAEPTKAASSQAKATNGDSEGAGSSPAATSGPSAPSSSAAAPAGNNGTASNVTSTPSTSQIQSNGARLVEISAGMAVIGAAALLI